MKIYILIHLWDNKLSNLLELSRFTALLYKRVSSKNTDFFFSLENNFSYSYLKFVLMITFKRPCKNFESKSINNKIFIRGTINWIKYN